MSLSLQELRLKHPRLDFTSSSWKITTAGLELSFAFTLEPLPPFRPTITIRGVDEKHLKNLSKEALDHYVLLIGMIESLSYWKAAASPQLSISAAPVSPAQLTWLEKLLKKGMGEYFYVNNIDFTRPDFVQLVSSAQDTKTHTFPIAQKHNPLPQESRYLIPIGGGKDSVVTLLSLLDQFKDTAPDILGTVVINPNQSQFDTIQGSHLPTITVDRHLDPALFDLNEQGYLNGHTPFSAMAAAVTTLVAKLFGYTHVLTSNERSSNEGSVWYRGEYVNHQYSKTLELENDFREYAERFLDQSPAYSSYLRPLYELQIAKLFSVLTSPPKWQHLRQAFRSCNRGKKTNSWCGNCSKCLFAFVILSPFIKVSELTEIFGRNVLENPDLVTAALELVGGTPAKPLECVGTLAESKIVFGLLIEQYQGKQLPVVLEAVKPYLSSPEDTHRTMNELLWSWDEENTAPPELGSPLRARLHSLLSSTPSPWETLPPSLQKIETHKATLVVAGFGREGQSTYEYLRNALPPTVPLVIVDDKEFSELSTFQQNLIKRDTRCTYLKTSNSTWQRVGHPVLFKTPGLPLHHPIVTHAKNANWPTITNTQLLFEILESWLGKQKKKYATIGITGTKGKSTTTSLVHHVLKTAGLNSFLGGNIGVPPLDLLPSLYKELAENPSSNSPFYIVLELSAHQLSDLRVSPNIAIVQDIVPEHLDYYPDFETYKNAKSHIARYQTENDVIIFNETLEQPSHLAELSSGKKLPFGPKHSAAWVNELEIFTNDEHLMTVLQVPLLGSFNLHNVLPSIVLAQYIGIPREVLKKAISSFKSLPHRLEKVRDHNGVLYVNDSLSTIPEAAQNAINSLAPRPIILLAGGYDRHISFKAFAKFLTQSTIKKLILFLPTGEHILDELKQLGSSAERLVKTSSVVTTMAEAMTIAHAAAQPGDVILLSPASASFGEFKDYQDRGDQFKLLSQNVK